MAEIDFTNLISEARTYLKNTGSIPLKCQSILKRFIVATEMIAAQQIYADLMVSRLRGMMEAIEALRPPERGPGCWCHHSRDVEGFGHEDRCLRARAAMGKGERT